MPEPLVIWRLTDGKPGHMQQTLGLVRALAALTPCEVTDFDLSATPVGAWDWLRGRFPPGAGRQPPRLIVGAGHATHWGLLAARRQTGGRAVVLMKPSLPVALFDVVIVPEHDGMRPGPRVIATRGVLNPMRPGVKRAGSLLVLIGGPSKHVRWDDDTILRQLQAVVASLPAGSDWRLTDSRRTPDSMRAALRQSWGDRFQPWSDCPPGWLAEQLAETEAVWVSEDSVSMVYESLTAGCRVGLLGLPPVDAGGRIMRGIQSLQLAGLVTGFDAWSRERTLPPATGLDEAARVARLLLERLDG